jgi:integrase
MLDGARHRKILRTRCAPKALERALPVTGIEHFRDHDLRRTAVTRVEEMGVQPHVISHVLTLCGTRETEGG